MGHTKSLHDDRLRAKSDPDRKPGWWQVLRNIALAPVRLHHYRAIHTQMLRDALCAADCGPLTRRERDDSRSRS